MKYFIILLILVINSSLLAKSEITIERAYPKSKMEREIEKTGSIVSNGSNFFAKKVKNTDSCAKIGNVNKYLYQATLEILKIAPLTSADPRAGVISTDWYVEKIGAEIRYRANVYIKDGAISPEAIEVKAFQQRKIAGDWKDYKMSEDKAASLEEEILRMARLLYQESSK